MVDRFRAAFKVKEIHPCIPGGTSRDRPVPNDKRRDKRRNRIEIMFGRVKDQHRVATRCDRCPKMLRSVTAGAAETIFWF